jgi:hypothetical protein
MTAREKRKQLYRDKAGITGKARENEKREKRKAKSGVDVPVETVDGDEDGEKTVSKKTKKRRIEDEAAVFGGYDHSAQAKEENAGTEKDKPASSKSLHQHAKHVQTKGALSEFAAE